MVGKTGEHANEEELFEADTHRQGKPVDSHSDWTPADLFASDSVLKVLQIR